MIEKISVKEIRSHIKNIREIDIIPDMMVCTPSTHKRLTLSSKKKFRGKKRWAKIDSKNKFDSLDVTNKGILNDR